jgi:enamine deaminase RidA (YjgF/YER057c/UK114 family)
MDIQKKLEDIGLGLPIPPAPGGNYSSVNVRGNIAYVAIQFPKLHDNFLYLGRMGDDISTEDGYKAMQLCALNVLSQVEHKIGFDNVIGLNHFDAYYRAGKIWDDAPRMVNGASDLFIKVLGDMGNHTRAILGVAHLPKGFCVGLTASFTVK